MKRSRRDVAFYAPWAGPNIAPDQNPSGGAEVQILQIARGLARAGADVAVAVYAVPGLPRRHDDLTVLRQWSPDWWPVPRRAAVLASSVVALVRCRARTLVQRSAGGTTGLAAVMARATRTRFVYSSASTIDFTSSRSRYNRLTAAMYELGIRWADEIVVQTDEQVELCIQRFGRRPRVIRSIAERAEPRPEAAPSSGFLWIGRIVGYKNPLAYLDLAQSLPDATFTMVCVPSDENALTVEVHRRAAALPNVTLLGPQARPELLRRTANATAIVSTSDFEGMPNTLLEGWARGVPSLTLSHDPDGVITRHDLGRTANGDPAELLHHTRELWDSRAASPWRERCLDHARTHHDSERIIGQWADALGVSAGVAPAPRRASRRAIDVQR